MTEELTLTYIEELRNSFRSDSNNRVIQNALSKNDIREMAINRNQVSIENNIFSNQVEPRVAVTNQKSSGRCWMFAALNVLRRELIKKYNLPNDFELSQTYLFFWDKLERMNYNLECIIQTADRNIDDRTVSTILNDPVADGGQWDMFVNLIKKYGIVPKSVYGETFHSSNSGAMNALFKTKFRQTAIYIRDILKKENGIEYARKCKHEFNKFAFNTLCKLLGTPPNNFIWEYVDKSKQYQRLYVKSPQEFFRDVLSVNLDDYVCIINDPRSDHEYYKLYTVEFLGNVVGGQPIRYLNVPIEVMENVTLASLMDNNVVWFGCDVGKERLDEIMSLDIKQYGDLLNTSFDMTKEERLETGESQMTHAMVFSGFNLIDLNGQKIVTRWEVENSWGKRAETNGYYIMTNEWFYEYMYEVVVHKKYATQHMLDSLASQEVTTLPLWDPMGALAKNL